MNTRKATTEDIKELSRFTDFWLSGRGLKIKAPGAVNDCFISPSQHLKYILKYSTFITIHHKKIAAWAVVQHDGSLIHLLVTGYRRHEGIGSALLKFINPPRIHSKSDQSSGDPEMFYKKHGYKKVSTIKSHSRFDIDKIRPNRKPNIDIFLKI